MGSGQIQIVAVAYGLPCPVQLLQVEMAGSTDWVLTSDGTGRRYPRVTTRGATRHFPKRNNARCPSPAFVPAESQGFENRRTFPKPRGHRPGRQ